MIDFAIKNTLYNIPSHEMSLLYEKHFAKIRSLLPISSPDKIFIGAALIELWKSNSYCTLAKRYINEFNNAAMLNCHSKVFYLVCKHEFALDKSQVSRYMNVVSEFCSYQLLNDNCVCYESTVIKSEWSKFSYSQLVELLSLNAEQRKEILPEWSVSRIREYKKSLKAVAISQQNKKDDFEEPEEFKGYSRKQLLEHILFLQAENLKLSKMLEEVNKDGTSV